MHIRFLVVVVEDRHIVLEEAGDQEDLQLLRSHLPQQIHLTEVQVHLANTVRKEICLNLAYEKFN